METITTCSLVEEAHKALEALIIYYRGCPVGTLAALDPEVEALKHDQCFVRDFVSSAIAATSEATSKGTIIRSAGDRE